MRDLKIGDPAPTVILPRDGGEIVNLGDLKDQQIVLYFYPRDDTSGCTKEAIEFTENLQAFQDAGAVIYGISKDPVKKHDKFVAKHSLGIPLLSDEDGDVCERFGVWVEKSMYGKTYMGIERATFLIGSDENIAQIWRKVKVAGHVESVLDAVRST